MKFQPHGSSLDVHFSLIYGQIQAHLPEPMGRKSCSW
jgi:hypothetical protein